MINKRHELIVKNLHSIMSEVRIRSIGQIETLSPMPLEERIKHIESMLNDPEESVKNAAKASLGRLKGNSGSMEPQNPVMPNSQTISSSPIPPLQKTTEQKNITAQSPLFATSPVPTTPVPTMPNISPLPKLTPVVPNIGGGALSKPKPLTPSPVNKNDDIFNEPKDPSLIDISKNNDVSYLIDYIKQISSTRPSGYLAQLVELSCSAMDDVALVALQSLFYIKEPKVAIHILKLLENDTISSQRRFLMLKIIQETDVELDSVLIERVLNKEKDVIVKSGLVKVFARNSGASGINTLKRCLADADPRVRANTIEVIEEQKLGGCDTIIVSLLNDSENRVKVNAAKYLIKNGYIKAFYTLQNMLTSQEVWLRDSVIFALGEIGDRNCLTLLKMAMKDQNQGIRLSILKALAHINSNNSRAVLQAACGDPDPVVSQVARSLFEKLKNTPPQQEKVITVKSTEFPTEDSPVNSASSTNAAKTIQTQPVQATEPNKAVPNNIKPPLNSNLQPPVSVVQKPSLVPPIPTSQQNKSPVIPSKPLQQQKPEVANSGGIVFEKPRSQEIYDRLGSTDINIRNSAVRDIVFVMGNDQLILIRKALSLADESVRIAAVRILIRRGKPDIKPLLAELAKDHNETIRSLVQKALAL